MSSDGIYLTGLWFVNYSDSLKHSDVYEFTDLDIFKEISRWLDIYFSDSIPDFISPYKLDTTFFRQKVIDIMNNIKYGEVITYAILLQKLLFQGTLIKCLPRRLAVRLVPIQFALLFHVIERWQKS